MSFLVTAKFSTLPKFLKYLTVVLLLLCLTVIK